MQVIPAHIDDEPLYCSESQVEGGGGQRGVGLRLATEGVNDHASWLLIAVVRPCAAVYEAAFTLMEKREAVSGQCRERAREQSHFSRHCPV